MNFLSEDEIELIALDVLSTDLGYQTRFGPDLVEGAAPERTHAEVVLHRRLREAIDRINPAIPAEAREEAVKKVPRTASPELLVNNEAFHIMLTDGIDVKFRVGGDPLSLWERDGVREPKALRAIPVQATPV